MSFDLGAIDAVVGTPSGGRALLNIALELKSYQLEGNEPTAHLAIGRLLEPGGWGRDVAVRLIPDRDAAKRSKARRELAAYARNVKPGGIFRFDSCREGEPGRFDAEWAVALSHYPG
ncbi:MAG: hypothetical protein F9K43_27770, partial [Bauldia sp.]